MVKRYKKASKYKQLSAAERGKLEAYLSINTSISKVSKLINRSKSTISEEIKRGRYNGKCEANTAHKRDIQRNSNSHKHTKWRNLKFLRRGNLGCIS